MPKQPKGAVLTLRISEQEQEHLRRSAEARGQTVSEYVRSVVRGGGTPMSDTPVAHFGEQNFSGSTASVQRSGQDLQLHGGSWVVNGPCQYTSGPTMTVVASEMHQ